MHNLHEMSNTVFWGKNKKNITNLSSAEYAQTVVRVKSDPFRKQGSRLIHGFSSVFFFFFFFEVLWPSQPSGVMSSTVNYLTTRLLGSI